jgi:hypothetical protein
MSNVIRTHAFGRLPRKFNPRVPHRSALLLAGADHPPPPEAVDYTAGMPADFGMMLNDKIGDCTCAAFYHARQVWTFNAQRCEVTEPDRDVRRMYMESCGYVPGLFDPGGVEQDVLHYLLTRGAPIGPKGHQRDKLLAYVEVDPRHTIDVKSTIHECGVAYIGFPVPENVTYDNPVWDYDPSARMTRYGHAVILAGYDEKSALAISWGKRFTMTWAFVTKFVDEIYAIADAAWIEATGMTPAGLTLAELEEQMQALKTG